MKSLIFSLIFILLILALVITNAYAVQKKLTDLEIQIFAALEPSDFQQVIYYFENIEGFLSLTVEDELLYQISRGLFDCKEASPMDLEGEKNRLLCDIGQIRRLFGFDYKSIL